MIMIIIILMIMVIMKMISEVLMKGNSDNESNEWK